MLSELLGHDRKTVAQSVAALWERLGIDDEQLTKGFNAFAIDDTANNEALQRLRKTGFSSATAGTQYASNAVGASKAETANDKSLQNARAFSQAVVTAESLDQMIANINWQIDQIDERIDVIDARLEAATTERDEITHEFGTHEDILTAREETIENIENQQTIVDQALVDCNETQLAHERALMEQARARTPDAMAAAAERVTLTHAEAEAARTIYLKETATIEGFERSLAELDAAIERLGELSTEELALMEERGDLVMDRQQLIVLRERLQDPELRAAVERGEMTHQDILDMVPEELQSGIMDSLTARFQAGWEYGLDVVSDAYDSAVNGLSSMTESLTSTMSAVFSRATGSTTPESAEPDVQVTQAPATPAFQPTNTM